MKISLPTTDSLWRFANAKSTEFILKIGKKKFKYLTAEGIGKDKLRHFYIMLLHGYRKIK